MGKGYLVLIIKETGCSIIVINISSIRTMMCLEVLLVFNIIFVCDTTLFILLAFNKYNFAK